jgi:hypothetical protein
MKDFTCTLLGPGLKPESIGVQSLIKMLGNLDSAVKNTMREEDPHNVIKGGQLALVGLTEGSIPISLAFRGTASEYAMGKITAAISENNYDNLPPKVLDNLREIQTDLKNNGCNARFDSDSMEVPSALLTPTTIIEYSEETILKGNTLLYGYLMSIGGIEPAIRLQLEEKHAITIKTNKETVKSLEGRLYTEIGVEGEATWNTKFNKVISFKLSTVAPYNPTIEIQEAFAEISKHFSHEQYQKHLSEEQLNTDD